MEKISKKKGLIELLNPKDETEKALTWKDLRIPIFISDGQKSIHLLTAGDRSSGYYDRVRNFDIDFFYKKQDGGQKIEQLREEWKAEYDFILVDSRTGIIDNGGICTIQLPDILVLLFTATDLGLNGIPFVRKTAVQLGSNIPLNIFISSSNKDRLFKPRIEEELEVLKKKGLVTLWSDEDIYPGKNWAEAIEDHIANSKIILILISDNNRSTPGISEIDMIENYVKKNNSLIIPSILDNSVWYKETFLPERFAVFYRSWPIDYGQIEDNFDVFISEIVQRIEKSILLYQQQITESKNKPKPKGEIK